MSGSFLSKPRTPSCFVVSPQHRYKFSVVVRSQSLTTPSSGEVMGTSSLESKGVRIQGNDGYLRLVYKETVSVKTVTNRYQFTEKDSGVLY